MTQAILITAYKDFEHLEEIIKCFDARFEIFIHIDKKSLLTKEAKKVLNTYSSVKLISQKFRVNWGGVNHLKSILFLSKKALDNPNNFYFHLISGQDFPIQNREAFDNFFSENRNFEFLDYFSFPHSGWADNGGWDRVNFYNFYDWLNAKKPNSYRNIKRIVEFQKKIGFKRPFYSIAMAPKLYGGATWWSLSRECLSHVVDYTQENSFLLKRLKHTFCSEEIYFPTVIMNSKFSSKVENRNLRFIDWKYRNGNSPAILDDSDYESLMASKDFFARKFGHNFSKNLIKKIKKGIHA